MQAVFSGNYRKKLFVVLMIAALLSMSFAFAANRAYAVPSSTATTNVAMSTTQGGQNATWTITFVPGDDLIANLDSIILSSSYMEMMFPIPGYISFSSAPANFLFNGVPATSVTTTGWQHTIEVPIDLMAGMPVTLTVNNTPNPAPGTGSLGVWIYTNLNTSYSGYSNPNITFTAPAPSSPTGLAASEITPTGAKLSWNAVSGATGYNLYRDGAKVNGTPVAATSTTVTDLSPSTTYSFAVTAVNSGGESGHSATASVTTLAPPPSLDLGDQSGNAGDAIDIPLSVVNNSNAVVAVQFDLTFDPTFVSFVSVQEEASAIEYHKSAEGSYHFVIGSVDKAIIPSTIGKLRFTIAPGKAHLANTAITLSSIVMSDATPTTWTPANDQGTVTVRDTLAPTLGLSLSKTAYAENVNIVTVSDGTGSAITVQKWMKGNVDLATVKASGIVFSGSSQTVLTNGVYTIYVEDAAGNGVIATIEVDNIVLKGDVDGDGAVTLLDWTKTAKFILTKEVPDARQKFAADMNDDNVINVGDWVAIANRLVAIS